MTNPYRAMCAELVDSLHKHTSMWEGHEIDLVARARALLAQPVAEGPADGEVAAALIELRSTVMGLDQMKMYVAAQRVKRAAELLQRQHPQLVAPTDEELLRIYQVATPCYAVEQYRRELDFARAVLAKWGANAQ